MKNIFKGIFAALTAVSMMNAGCDKAEKYLRIDPESFDIASDELEVSASVEASASWMAYCNADWLEFSYGENALFITIKEKNESLEERAAVITVITGDGQTRPISILQRAMDAYIETTPSALAEFSSEGGTPQTVTVDTNLSQWGFSNREPWATVVQGIDTEANKLTIITERSWQLDDRRDSLIIAPVNNAFLPITDTIPIVQRGANLMITSEAMDSSHILRSSASETVIIISVYAKNTWSVTDDSGGRLSFDLTGGPADTENGTSMTVTVPANTGAEPYDYILTFTCGDGRYEYRLVQAAPTAPESEPEPEP